MNIFKEKITAKQMQEAIGHGFKVLVIINGEYYEYEPETITEKETTK